MELNRESAFTASVLAVGMFQVVGLYEATAPSLQEIRDFSPNETRGRQQLIDANIMVGSITLAVAGIACYATKSVLPAITFILAFCLVAGWRQLVLQSPNHT